MSLILENREVPLHLIDAVNRVTGTRPAYPTLWRWCKKGVAGIKLEYVLVGGRLYTSIEAVRRFVAATTEQHATEPDKEAASAAIDAVAAELKPPTKRELTRREKERQAVRAGLAAHYAGVK